MQMVPVSLQEARAAWRGLRVLVVVLPLAAVLAGCSPEPEPGGILDIPHPELGELEAPLAREIEARRAVLDTALDAADADPVKQALALGELGRLYQAHRLLEPARACYREAHARDPESFAWAYYLAVLAAGAGDVETASTVFRRALDMRPGDAPALVRLADLELERGEVEEAEALYLRAAAVNDSASAAYGLGRVAEQRGDFAGAVEHFQRALRLQPTASVIHYGLGQAFRELGRLDRAGEALAQSGTARVAMVDPLMHELTTLHVGASPHLDRGNAAVREGRLAEAESAYRQAVTADPSNSGAHLSLASVLVRRGQAEAALEHFAAAVRLEPENARARADLGGLLSDLGRSEEALEHLNRAVELEPGLVRALVAVGNLQARLGRPEEAQAAFRRALEEDDANGDARLGLGAVLAEIGDFDRAAAELQAALRLDDDSERAPRIHFGLAEALVRSGRLGEALPHYRRVRQLEPAEGQAWLREATVLMGLGRFADAGAVLEARLSVDSTDDRAAHSLARLLAGAQDPSLRDGGRALALVAALRPTAESAAWAETAAMALAEAGRFEEATSIQSTLVAEAQRRGLDGPRMRLTRNLERYRRAVPCCARSADAYPPW